MKKQIKYGVFILTLIIVFVIWLFYIRSSGLSLLAIEGTEEQQIYATRDLGKSFLLLMGGWTLIYFGITGIYEEFNKKKSKQKPSRQS